MPALAAVAPATFTEACRNMALTIFDSTTDEATPHARLGDGDRRLLLHTKRFAPLVEYIARRICDRLEHEPTKAHADGDMLCAVEPTEMTAFLLHGVAVEDWARLWAALGPEGAELGCVMWKGARTNNNDSGFPQVRRHEGLFRAFLASKSGTTKRSKVRLDRLIQLGLKGDARMEGREWVRFKLKHTCGERCCLNPHHFEVVPTKRARPAAAGGGRARKKRLCCA